MKSKNRLRFDLTTEGGRSLLQQFFPELAKTIPATTSELLIVDALAAHRELLTADPPYAAAVGARQAEAAQKRAALEAKVSAQLAAANARAAKKTAKAEAKPGSVIETDGPEPEEFAEPNGHDQAVEDMGIDDPNMSPAEAKEAGLALMRELFGAGKVAEMKAIQKAWGVAKFYDIPNEKGHEFYRQALQTMHETGLRK